MSNNNSNPQHGITFLGALAIAFIALKLCKVIDWSWLWVLAPIWFPITLAFAILIILGIIYTIIAFK